MTADRGAHDSNPSASLQRSRPTLNMPRVASPNARSARLLRKYPVRAG
jgi:hypothetical protein